MILTVLLLRNSFKIFFASVSLLACNLMNQPLDSLADNSWKDLTCDTAQHVNELNIYTLAQPFYLSDTLLEQALKPRRIYLAFADSAGNIQTMALQAGAEEVSQFIETKAFPTLNTSWQEQAYLWALVKQPNFLYERWENTLADERKVFLEKRDSIVAIMKKKQRSIKVISDLRSTSRQLLYLGKNKTATPLSMHNFGLAADVAIYTRRRRISNNLALYRPLDSLTEAYGLTWGGNFVGFIDSGHFQLYKNGAELLRKHPELVFEFEPFRPQYSLWMNKMVGLGKENKAEDTKELLQELNKIKQDKPCQCVDVHGKTPSDLLDKIQFQLAKQDDYQFENDLLLVGDLASQTVTLASSKNKITFPLGLWK